MLTMFQRQHNILKVKVFKVQRRTTEKLIKDQRKLTLFLTVFSVFRRGDLPFNVRRAIPRGTLESDEESEAKSETPEPKPE